MADNFSEAELERLVNRLINRLDNSTGDRSTTAAIKRLETSLRNVQTAIRDNKLDPKDIGNAFASSVGTILDETGEDGRKIKPKSDITVTDKFKKGLAQTDSKLYEFGNSISNLTNNGFKGITKAFTSGLSVGALSSSINEIGNILEQSVDSYRQFAAVGTTFGGDITKMMDAAAKAGMSLEDFTKYTLAAGQGARNLGITRFAQLSNSIRKANMDVGNFGMTTQQSVEALGAVLDFERLSGNIIDDKTTEKNFRGLMVSITELSSAYGKSRKEILDSRKDVARDFDLQSAFISGGLSDTDIKALTSVMSALPGELGESFKDSLIFQLQNGKMTDTYSQRSAVAGDFQKTTDTVTGNLIARLKSGVQAQDAIAEFNREYVTSGKAVVDANRSMAGNMGTLSNETKEIYGRAFIAFRELSAVNLDKIGEDRAGASKQTQLTQGLLGVEEIQNELKALYARGYTELIKSFETPLASFTTSITQSKEGLMQLNTSLSTLNDKTTSLSQTFQMMGSAINTTFSNGAGWGLLASTALAAAIPLGSLAVGLYSLSKATQMVTQVMGNAGTILETTSSSGGAVGGGGKFGKLGKLAKGAGAAVGVAGALYTVGSDVYQMYNSNQDAKEGKISAEQNAENQKKGYYQLGGAATGALVGGILGSVVPVIGTTIGASVGSIVGDTLGEYAYEWIGKDSSPGNTQRPESIMGSNTDNTEVEQNQLLTSQNQIVDNTSQQLALAKQQLAAIERMIIALNDSLPRIDNNTRDTITAIRNITNVV